MVEQIELCPKCNAVIERKGFLGHADKDGILSVVSHDIEIRQGNFGSFEHVGRRCFLTVEETKKIFEFHHVIDDIYEDDIYLVLLEKTHTERDCQKCFHIHFKNPKTNETLSCSRAGCECRDFDDGECHDESM